MRLDAHITEDAAGLDYDGLYDEFDWVRAMAGTPQDPRYHAEGDVWTHTRMVCDALVRDDAWPHLDAGTRRLMLVAALLHDAGKPEVTFTDDDGRIRSPEHSVRGEVLARRLLWKMDAPFAFRERVAALVRHHMQPRYLPGSRDPRRRTYATSQLVRCDLLALLARADARGRVSPDAGRALAQVHRFAQLCMTHDCLTQPRAFTSDHARFLYFQRRIDDPDAMVQPARGPTVTIMSGLPGSGKDTWVAQHRAGRSVISLDAIRLETGVSPVDRQEPVMRLAHERARGLLEEGEDFIWNATTLSRRHRRTLLALAAPFDARIEMVHIDAPPALLLERNRGRAAHAVVPDDVILRMTRIWQPPDLTEAHAVHHIVHDDIAAARRAS